MSQGIARNPRIHDIHRKRSIVTFYFFVLYSKNRNVLLHVTKKAYIFGFSFTLSVELSWVLLRPAEVQRGLHDYARTGTSLAIQGTCINPDCNSSPSTICMGCTNDVGLVFCCKPKPGKRCWERLHEARAPDRVDANGIAVERPSLIKKRKRNSNLGSERKPKRLKKPLSLNPHHIQLE